MTVSTRGFVKSSNFLFPGGREEVPRRTTACLPCPPLPPPAPHLCSGSPCCFPCVNCLDGVFPGQGQAAQHQLVGVGGVGHLGQAGREAG